MSHTTRPLILRKLALTLLVPVIAVAGFACRHNPEARADKIVEMIADKLDLNAEQKTKLDAVKLKVLAGRKEMRAAQKSRVDAALAEINKDQMDPKVLKNLIREGMNAWEAHLDPIVNDLVVFHASLTKEQRAKLSEEINSKMRHFRKHDKEQE